MSPARQIFLNDGTVLHISMHRYEPKKFYPSSGGLTDVGIADGVRCPRARSHPVGDREDPCFAPAASQALVFHGVACPLYSSCHSR